MSAKVLVPPPNCYLSYEEDPQQDLALDLACAG